MGLAREVLSVIPEFLSAPNVLGIGEIGLNKNSRNELQVLEEHIALALAHRTLILVHTPHLEDKLKGTRLILDALRNQGADPGRVLIDHVEEHTVGPVLDGGYWAGMTLYPDTKCTAARAVDILERLGTRTPLDELRRGLGSQRPPRGGEARQEMRAGPRRGRDPPGHVREPAALPLPVRPLLGGAAASHGRGSVPLGTRRRPTILPL